MDSLTISSIISILFAISIVSWFASLVFTGDKNDEKYKDSLVQPIANKKWKTFLVLFVGYCVIFAILIYYNK